MNDYEGKDWKFESLEHVLSQIARRELMFLQAVMLPLDVREDHGIPWNAFHAGLDALARMESEAPVGVFRDVMHELDTYVRTGCKWGWYWNAMKPRPWS